MRTINKVGLLVILAAIFMLLYDNMELPKAEQVIYLVMFWGGSIFFGVPDKNSEDKC